MTDTAERAIFMGYEVRHDRTVALLCFPSDEWEGRPPRPFDRASMETRLRNLQNCGLPHDVTARVLAEWPEGER